MEKFVFEPYNLALVLIARVDRTTNFDMDLVIAVARFPNAQDCVGDLPPCVVALPKLGVVSFSAGGGEEPQNSLKTTRTPPAWAADSPFPPFIQTALWHRAFGFKTFELKVSGDLSQDRRRVKTLGLLGIPRSRIRLDANNLRDDPSTAASFLADLGPLAAVEEPVQARAFQAVQTIARQATTRVILDESFLRHKDFSAITADPQRWIINIRVSKMVGILRSLAVARRRRELAIPVVVAAQFGETSVLTRAALPIAQAAGDALFAQEGAFGNRLIQRDVCTDPLMFGYGGLLRTSDFQLRDRPGLGLDCQG